MLSESVLSVRKELFPQNKTAVSDMPKVNIQKKVQPTDADMVQTSLSFENIYYSLWEIAGRYSSFCQFRVIGNSHDERMIPMLEVGTGAQMIFCVAGINGTQALLPELLLKMAGEYCRAYECGWKLDEFYELMKTTGDRILDRSLEQIGGKGLFVKELDQALRKGRVDLSVHSLKDMPMDIPEDLPILAYSKREDPRDVLIFRQGQAESISGGMIGTSSKRRRLQLERLYPDCHFQGIRGNVQTRLRKLEEEGFCATVLAAAGLKRLGMDSCIGRYFSCEEMIPAAGQ